MTWYFWQCPRGFDPLDELTQLSFVGASWQYVRELAGSVVKSESMYESSLDFWLQVQRVTYLPMRVDLIEQDK